MRTGEPLTHIELHTPTGETVEIGTYLDRILLVQALRYYG